MNTVIKKGLYCALLVGGLSLIGISAANAAEEPSATGADGIASGSQVVTDLTAPITLTGNAISVLGDSSTGGTPAPVNTDAAPVSLAPTTTGTDGVASGTQVVPTADSPVTVSGNAISVLGDSSSSDSAPVTAAPLTQPSTASTTSPTTTGTDSLLGGTQVAPVITAPIVADGNAISVIGDSSSGSESTTPGSDATTVDASPTTTGSDSTLGGTQVLTNLIAPVTVQGNAISVLGDSDSEAATSGTSTLASTGTAVPNTAGTDSLLGGTQIVPLIALSNSVSDNAVSVVGDSSTVAPTETSSSGISTTSGSTTTTSTTTTSTTVPQPITLLGTEPAARGTGNSSLAALRLTPLGGSTMAGSTLASTGTTPLPYLALGLLLALAGLGLAGRGIVARGLIARGGDTA